MLLTAAGTAVYAAPGYLVFLRQGAVVAQRFDAGSRRLRGTPLAIRELVDAPASYSGSPVVAVSQDGLLVQRELRSTNTRVDILDREGRLQKTLALPESHISNIIINNNNNNNNKHTHTHTHTHTQPTNHQSSSTTSPPTTPTPACFDLAHQIIRQCADGELLGNAQAGTCPS